MDVAKITLYEIIGYLVPGALGVFALLAVFALLGDGTAVLPESVPALASLALLAYFCGHAFQAVANLWSPRFERRELEHAAAKLAAFRQEHRIPPAAGMEEAYRTAQTLAGTDHPQVRNLDTYVEREGFYRGGAMGLATVATVDAASLWGRPWTLEVSGTALRIGFGQKSTILVLAVATALLFLLRYRRFLRYRIHAVLDAATTGHARPAAD